MPSTKRLIAFTVYPGVTTPLDLVGPLTVLRNLAIRSPYRTSSWPNAPSRCRPTRR